MAIKEVTYYQAVCDCCGAVDDGGDYSAHADEDAALESAIDSDDFKEVDGELLCPDCWIDEEDMEGFEGVGNTDYVPRRRHDRHGGPDREWSCGAQHPETGQQCTVTGEHAIHSVSVEDGPDWTNS